ncbi:MAG: HEAT repeat domain-containing protein [Flavobacteriales bacterium]|nr:HEAT repeat domain-containing protein [Flavobacteriales bacterium]
MAENAKIIAEIIKDFKADEIKVVLEAIKKNRKEGNSSTFKALLDLLKDTDEPLIEANIIEFLYDLKDEESIPVLVQAIQDEEYAFYHNFLVAAFWQSAIDGADYLEVFLKAAIKGEYMTTLEALTVIENFDSAFAQEDLMNYESELNEAIEGEENEDKKALLISINDVVRNLPIEGE